MPLSFEKIVSTYNLKNKAPSFKKTKITKQAGFRCLSIEEFRLHCGRQRLNMRAFYYLHEGY